MGKKIVICDHHHVDASLVPSELSGSPGQCPSGVYDTILMEKGRLLDWSRHWERFVVDCQTAGFDVPWDEKSILSHIRELREAQPGVADHLKLRLMAFFQEQVCQNGLTFKAIAQLSDAVLPDDRITSVDCMAAIEPRDSQDRSYCQKRTRRKKEAAALHFAKSQGFDDVLFLSDKGHICEAAYANILLYMDGKIFTPCLESPCLPGVTRQRIIDAAVSLDIMVESREFLPSHLIREAESIFLSSSLRGLAIVNRIDTIWLNRSGMPLILRELWTKAKQMMQDSSVSL